MEHQTKHKDHTSSHHEEAESTTGEYIKFTLIIVTIITGANILYFVSDSAGAMEWMRWFMGVFMLTFAGFKFAGYKMFVSMFPMYDLLAKRTQAYAYAYPFIEFGIAVLFLADVLPTPRSVLTVLIMGLGAIGIVKTTYIQKKRIHCACLGNIIKLPLSTVSLADDVAMLTMAIVMLAAS